MGKTGRDYRSRNHKILIKENKMAIATPKKCFKCGKVKMMGDCGFPICDECKNTNSNKYKVSLKSAIAEWIKEKFGKKQK